MPKAALSKRAQDELVQWVAANGESYGPYVRYAQARGWHVYTEGTFHNWVQRRRYKVQAARRLHEAEVRKATVLNKERRVQLLEARVNEINQKLEEGGHSVKDLLDLMETQRKLLQAIAQERGEWNKPVDDNPANDAMLQVLKRMENAAKQLPEGNRTVIDVPVRVHEGEPVAAT